ncbi:PD-(D/E)XK nuclease family protein [Neoehrlichia mikurensis]|uniref:PD-(D/E)XK nuclease family protein n=1 Tax=Neoehrlichia mikurensis TaxID=89586 RepID=UPI001C43E961|nr:PD-(D/E)XK nuclease family protein [Neoehrlichia mikurensis]QXK92550.1 PD-(D/E)XK nuclease family protein [Neoehrlichia mikurensis]QXK93786.1 PD-(D/E)XK nuclease family protein [Neoehrlichia mikurensis]
MNNSQVFTVHCSESFLDVVAHYICTQHNTIVIVPDEDDVKFISTVLIKLNYNMDNTVILSFMEVKRKLVMLHEDADDTKLLFLMQFIESWNKENDDNYSVLLSNELLSLLDELQVNCIQFDSLRDLFVVDDSEYWQKTSKFLCDLVHKWKLKYDVNLIKNFCIDELICQWKEHYPSYKVILAVMDCSKLFLHFVRAVYKLIDSKIILPYVNFDISDNDWQNLDKKHYQYSIKNVLYELNITRQDVKQLECKSYYNIIIEKLFNFNVLFNTSNDKSTNFNNIELITCTSEEEEAYVVCNLITLYEGAKVFVSNNSLVSRIRSILNIDNMQACNNNNYLIPVFLLYVIDAVLLSNSLSLLSLLKHPFVRLGYAIDEYNILLDEFELQVIRQRSDVNFNNFDEICDSLSVFCNKITAALSPLVLANDQSISDISSAHVLCVRYFISGNQDCDIILIIEEFFTYLQNMLKDITIYSLGKYKEILKLILDNYFSCNIFDRLTNVNVISREVVILAGFNEEEHYNNGTFLNSSMRQKIGLPSADEQEGYFNYILYSILYTKKVYITRSIRSFGKITEEPILIKYLRILLEEYNYINYDTLRYRHAFNNIEIKPYNNYAYNVGLEVRLKTFSVITTTAIEDLINNPYVFYVRNVLNIAPIKEINTQFLLKDFGNAIHIIFQKYLLQVGINNNYDLLMKIAEHEFANLYKNCTYAESMWWPKFKKISDNFFDLDIKRKNNVRFIEVEKVFSWRINPEITVIAKCDRVEYLKDGSIAIIDYKTGNIPLQIDIQHGFAPQLIVQALAVMYSTNRQISDLAYWKVDTEQVSVVSIKDFDNIIRFTEENLSKFLNSYLYDEILFHHINNSESSRYKDYELLMRNK